MRISQKFDSKKISILNTKISEVGEVGSNIRTICCSDTVCVIGQWNESQPTLTQLWYTRDGISFIPVSNSYANKPHSYCFLHNGKFYDLTWGGSSFEIYNSDKDDGFNWVKNTSFIFPFGTSNADYKSFDGVLYALKSSSTDLAISYDDGLSWVIKSFPSTLPTDLASPFAGKNISLSSFPDFRKVGDYFLANIILNWYGPNLQGNFLVRTIDFDSWQFIPLDMARLGLTYKSGGVDDHPYIGKMYSRNSVILFYAPTSVKTYANDVPHFWFSINGGDSFQKGYFQNFDFDGTTDLGIETKDFIAINYKSTNGTSLTAGQAISFDGVSFHQIGKDSLKSTFIGYRSSNFFGDRFFGQKGGYTNEVLLGLNL